MTRKLIALLTLCLLAVRVYAQSGIEEFTVGDIRVEGLQRISEGTVYNYLPVNIGDHLDQQRLQEALRALYKTGFFRDVELRRDGNTLVIVVLERPSIESFDIKGNKDIKTEDLQKSLRNVGLAAGKTYDQSVLEDVKQYLTDQYFSRGKYAVRIDTNVEEVPGNKVKITVNVAEGKRAKIREITIVGNSSYKDKQLREDFELNTPNWLSFYKQDDRYSRESLQGDLEKLRSYYMDRGYANFQIESAQVAIAPEKDDIFITVNVHEGDIFKIGEVKLAGTMVVPEAQLRRLVLVHPGDTFSNKLVTQSQQLISYRLGEQGYAFAKIDPVPTPDNAKKEVSLTFFIEPGNRVYVRHINFLGTSSIDDEVLRREMRQMEGGWLSNAAVERSKERIQRLPYVEKVDYETTPVPGAADQVDVDFTIKEGLPGQFGGGVGYSESQGLILNGNFTHSNFMGSGERIQAEINAGKFSKVYSISHTDPYRTIDGVSRTITLAYRDITQFVSASSDFDTKNLTAGLDYAYPVTEYQSVHWGVSAQRNEILTSENGSAQQAVDWVKNNGDPFVHNEPDGIGGEITFFGTKYTAIELIGGWSYDTRNRAIFADHGSRHALSLSIAAPGSNVQYWVANYDYLQFVPLPGPFTLALIGDFAYGEDIGDTTALPPYRQFFAGGPDSVRGYKESRLGPKDNFGNPYGGNMKVVGRAEILFPVPEKWKTSARFSAFFDMGNVFSTGHVNFTGRDGVTPVDYKFAYDQLKQSAGIAVQWLAPLGIFRFSYAFPLNASDGDAIHFKDETEGFQFSIGQAF
ncbi:MAG TPA: outer membrane protein assembly factor BamA [Steroidobacteraceae bacterium]|nr:outer membrane protein assembly factor BamA [Steroidobacteraceae bacterium]